MVFYRKKDLAFYTTRKGAGNHVTKTYEKHPQETLLIRNENVAFRI